MTSSTKRRAKTPLEKQQAREKKRVAAFARDPFYHSREYREWRQAVFRRDGYRCRWCKSKKRIEADHIMPRAARPDLALVLSNGRTLCKSCHRQTPTYGFRATAYKGII